MKKRLVMLLLTGVVVLSIAVVWRAPQLHPKHVGAGQGRIAVIYVEGMIVGGRGQSSLLTDYGGTDTLMKELRDAQEDDTVRAVVLRINSPGGSTPATQEVAEEINRIRSSGKPIVTSMGDVAASGGYWLAASTDRIYANPSTLTGSIGVYMPYANWEELYKKIGIHQEKIKSGPHKDILSPERNITQEERAIIQTMVDDIYEQFVAVVAEGRRLDPAKVRKLADGRIYTGNQAQQAGLVDELGNLYDAIDGAAKLAGIEGKPEVREYGKTVPWSMLLGANDHLDLIRMMNGSGVRPPVVSPLAIPEHWLQGESP